jgi:hypothetical protein
MACPHWKVYEVPDQDINKIGLPSELPQYHPPKPLLRGKARRDGGIACLKPRRGGNFALAHRC